MKTQYAVYRNGCHEYTAVNLWYALRFVGGQNFNWGNVTCFEAMNNGWEIRPV